MPRATDFAIVQGWADSNRLAILGWSAAGFMTSWTVTQTNRYRLRSKAQASPAGPHSCGPAACCKFDYDGRWPEADPSAFAQFSATAHASRVTTPILILHGDAGRGCQRSKGASSSKRWPRGARGW
ncbi:MAG: alpha/beta hydrolase family protein [Bryobacteraceae bacterium]